MVDDEGALVAVVGSDEVDLEGGAELDGGGEVAGAVVVRVLVGALLVGACEVARAEDGADDGADERWRRTVGATIGALLVRCFVEPLDECAGTDAGELLAGG